MSANTKTLITFTGDEVELILSALRSDRVGTWGDGREERIQKIMAKIKGTKPVAKATGFTA